MHGNETSIKSGKASSFHGEQINHLWEGLFMSIRDKYAIVGVGYTPQGRIPGRTELSFHLEAIINAVDDAGLTKKDVDGLICYRHFPPASDSYDITPYMVAQHLGMTPSFISQDAN